MKHRIIKIIFYFLKCEVWKLLYIIYEERKESSLYSLLSLIDNFHLLIRNRIITNPGADLRKF